MRTVVALFDRFEEAQEAIRALTDQGFPNAEINLIASDERGEYSRQLGNMGETRETEDDVTDGAAAGAGIGAVLGGIGGLLLGLGALAIPGIGPVVAAGPIVATLAGAGIGAVAGGLIGALVDLGIPEEHAEYYAEGVRRGGTLVTVRTDDMRAEDARTVLNRFNPVDIDTRAQTWRDEGWSGFSEGDTAMQYDRDVTDMDDRTRDDVFGTERAGRNVDVPVTGGGLTGMTGTTSTMGTGPGFADDDWDMYDQTFRSDYQTRYGTTAYDYDYYQPAYYYGYTLTRDERYRGYDWDRLEPEARRDWERREEGGAWEEVKDAVRHAWERVTR